MATKWLTSTTGLASAPEALVTMVIAGMSVDLQLKDVRKFVRENGLEWKQPTSATVNGVATGIFPVVSPKTESAAKALSKVVGYEVPVGDGVRFAIQARAKRVVNSLVNLGVNLDELVREWQIGKPKGASHEDYAQPLKVEVVAGQYEAVMAQECKEIFG